MRARPRGQGIGIVAAFATCLAGCFAAPGRPGNAASDAHADTRFDGTTGNAPVVRKIGDAWYASSGHSQNMSSTGYSIPTTGIVNGDLVLFIANIDNGSNSAWSLPTTSFHTIVQTNFGSDGQTFFAAWAIANGEPPEYAQSYGPGINSADAAITLLAITGADPVAPIAVPMAGGTGSTGSDPVVLTSAGVTTTAPNSLVIFAGGADWLAADSTATFMAPGGFNPIDAFGDRGGVTFEWTTLLVASEVQPTVGATGPHTGMISTIPWRSGIPWTLELAVAPAP